MKRHFCCIVFFLLAVSNAHAVIYTDCQFESAPSSENSGGVYTCDTGSTTLYFASEMTGSIFDHTTNEGWNNSGAAKFYTHNGSTNSYRVMNGNVSSWTPATQNIRFLIKIESTGVLSGKWLYTGAGGVWPTYVAMTGSGAPCNQPSITMNYSWASNYVLHQGNLTCPTFYEVCGASGTWGSLIEDCTEVVTDKRWNWADHTEEWVCIEQEKNFNNGTMAMYVWTQDGTWSGKVYEVDTTLESGSERRTSAIGAYLELTHTNQYFIIDELIIADEYIGPPAGFLTTPSGPTTSTMSGTASIVSP